MPTTEQILSQLNRITNEWTNLATIWHVYYAVIVMLLITRVCRSTRSIGLLLATPLLSVAALAWINGNPFNGSLFTLGGTILLAIAMLLPKQSILPGFHWMIAAGGFLLLFAWVYPHFLIASSSWKYLYASPLGLIPCPTLSASIGATMTINLLRSRRWTLTLGILGLFYGLFGSIVLGVTIDLVLVIGAFTAIFASYILKKKDLRPGTLK